MNCFDFVTRSLRSFALPGAALLAAPAFVCGHGEPYPHHHAEVADVRALPEVAEESGPVMSRSLVGRDVPVSGQGFWTFAAAPDLVPIPVEAAPHVVGAHGTVVVDQKNDVVYWGLAKVGWIAYRNGLTEGTIIAGDPAFAKGNLHGADLREGADGVSLIAVADNESGAVYLSDTSFAEARILDWPQGGPYAAKGEFRPTDVAFTDEDTLYVTDGYGRAYFMRAHADPLAYEGTFIGGKELSQTPHGITYRGEDGTLLISARPEGEVKRMKLADGDWLETFGLPAGSTVCDIDIWGDYALAPCLNGPNGSPGPIYILNLKERTIASIIKPKEELGFGDAQHIHDAAWYFSGEGEEREVFIVFTNWNPGGVGAVKLVTAK